jgi:molybdenum cofactor cytidylyltransferase
MTPAPAAIILAAGKGGRIGQPKHRLRAGGGETFLEIVARVAYRAGLRPVICVVAPDEKANVAIQASNEYGVVVNHDPSRGMLSSLQEGMNGVAADAGVFVFPVDHPYITPASLDVLIRVVRADPKVVVKPEFNRHGGHPVYLPASMRALVLCADVSLSLRTVIEQSRLPVIRVPVEDDGVIHNVNTPDDIR